MSGVGVCVPQAICCDANIEHDAAVKLLVAPLLPLLVPGGVLVFTVKCATKFVNEKFLSEVTAGLEGAFRDSDGEPRKWRAMKVCWLLANTENERTVVAVAE